MRCYNHPEKEASAICRACGKAVCSVCANDLGRGIACKNKCEKDVKAIINSLDNNSAGYETMKPRLLLRPALLGLLGAVFAFYGYTMYGVSNLLFILGSVIILIEGIELVSNFIYIKRIKKVTS